jgi:hypothetical protein
LVGPVTPLAPFAPRPASRTTRVKVTLDAAMIAAMLEAPGFVAEGATKVRSCTSIAALLRPVMDSA